jgi:hypothetical protein
VSRIQYVEDAVVAAEKSDLVVEAIVENMAAKHELFSKLDKAAPQQVSCMGIIGCPFVFIPIIIKYYTQN